MAHRIPRGLHASDYAGMSKLDIEENPNHRTFRQMHATLFAKGSSEEAELCDFYVDSGNDSQCALDSSFHATLEHCTNYHNCAIYKDRMERDSN